MHGNGNSTECYVRICSHFSARACVCVLVTTLFHIYILLFAFEGHVLIMGKTKHGSLKALVGQDRGGRGILGSKAKCVKYMWRSEHSEAETREALVDLRVNRQRRFNLMREYSTHYLKERASPHLLMSAW